MKREAIAYVPIDELENITENHANIFTRINIAFAKIKDNKIYYPKNINRKTLRKLKLYNPDLKIVLSIGGGGAFGFSNMAMTRETRALFLNSMVETVMDYKFDGIDLDWEFPCADWGGDYSPKDKQNFTILLKEMREYLDNIGDRHYILSIAAGQGQWFIDTTEVSIYHKYLDDIMLMTYDLRGFGQEITGHHTTLYTKKDDIFKSSSVHDGIIMLNKEGVPNDKIVIGFAQYSRFWEGVESTNNGLLQKAKSGGGDFYYQYPELIKEVIQNKDFETFFDDEAKVPWAYSKSKKIFVSYDDEKSVDEKIKYVIDNNLKGIMFWRYVDWKENPLIEKMKKLK